MSSSRPRFGGPSASRVYAVKVQWLMGSLIALIAVLISALVVFARAEPSRSEPGAALPPPAATRTVLVAASRERIEQNVALDAAMVSTIELDAAVVPPGTVVAADLPRVLGQYTTRMIPPAMPLTFDALSRSEPFRELPIPAGFRAVTVPIDELSSNGYQIRPDQRVDVILTHADSGGRPEVTPVVRMTKVLSIGNGTDPREKNVGARSATLLVTADDALRVELAKKIGTLSLVLAGLDEVPPDQQTSQPCNETCLFRRAPEERALAPAPGRMCTTDLLTHRPVCFELRDRRWKVAAEG